MNIADMPAGREMDALVAEKVMGYALDYEFRDYTGAPFVPALRDQYDEFGMLPEYSTDIADAWRVVERMQAEHWDDWIRAIQNSYLYRLDAKEAALAICRAALKVVGVTA